MPRPPVKRSKLNTSNQAAKRTPNNPLSSSPAARRRQLHEKLAHKSIGRVPDDSDDSDELVVKSSTPRNRRGVPRQEIYASGGVAKGDQVAAHKSSSHKRERVVPEELSRSEARLNGGGKNAQPKTRGLRPINRLSTSQTAPPTTSKVPTSVIRSPAEYASVHASREGGRKSPAAETSILGPIRTRKRQPSILRSIDGPDSSVLDPDLEDFLPDDQSTPLNTSRKRKLSRSPRVSTPVQSAPQADVLTTGNTDVTNGQPDLPPLLPSATSQRQQSPPEIDSDTMAPPQSSSSSPSPVKAKTPLPSTTKLNNRKTKESKPLSTAALQALMPTRRQQRARRERAAKATSEFDIPEDSSDPPNGAAENQAADPDAGESYIASPKPTRKGKKTTLHQTMKLQKRNKLPTLQKSNPKSSRTSKGKEGGGAEGGRSIYGKPKRHNSSTHSPSPSPPTSKSISTTRATPLAAVAKISSSSQQQQQPKQQAPPPPPPPQSTRGKSLRSYSKAAREPEQGDKENRPSHSSADSSRRGKVTPRQSRGEALPPDDTDDTDDDISIEIGRPYRRSGTIAAAAAAAAAAAIADADADDESGADLLRQEQARLAQKFKEVDDWDLEFEDVTMMDDG
ncbi:hypothetical protein GJ744_002894 [Endocarpon pusillum]|uniref:Uncharacterized protein n=1 Tax=Endocarpon pusillum TaxID=364733 RepID=A0A8H7A7E0_9EURO|nr:hypothetical protein GJ744_002894 [Endocarpon pusillum]